MRETWESTRSPAMNSPKEASSAALADILHRTANAADRFSWQSTPFFSIY
jgi:hypothetical protein